MLENLNILLLSVTPRKQGIMPKIMFKMFHDAKFNNSKLWLLGAPQNKIF